MTLRTNLLRIASELPQGDPTRREILAAVSKGSALSDNVNVRLMERDIHEFIDNKLRVLEGAEERDIASAATQARIAVAKILRYL